MLWPFNRPSTRPDPTIEAIYGMIVAQARLPLFYERFGVPDTVNGRFDMVLLHLWLVLRRLRSCADGVATAQALFDRFCRDMDDNLREMGVGDLLVPRKMRGFGEAFYGRSRAYDAALEAGGRALAEALARNVLVADAAPSADRLADYALAALRSLAAVDDQRLLRGAWSFAEPAALMQPQEQLP